MSKLEKEYDVIIAGGGVNGLACAAYLQKSGLKVAVFERRAEGGGGCNTHETVQPGAKVNLCANMILTMYSPAYDELELERFGFEMRPSGEWCFFYPFKRDRKAVLTHSWDARKTYQHWQSFNKHDAEVYRTLVNYYAPRIVDWYEMCFFRPLTLETGMRLVEDLKGCPALPSDLVTMSDAELYEELYQDNYIKNANHALGMMWGGETAVPGTALGKQIFSGIVQHMQYQSGVPRGGSHALVHAVSRCLLHYGGSIFTNCPVTKIIVENGEAKGVVLSKDAIYPEAEVRATRAVVSNLSPHPTFINLVGLDKLPEYAEAIKAYSYRGPVLFTTFWVLNEPLDWEGAGYPKEISRTYGFNYGLDNGIEDVNRWYSDFQANRLPDPPVVCGMCFQAFSFVDPSQAPPGHQVVTTWAHVPNLPDLTAWDDIKEGYGDKVEDLLAEYVPNIKKAKTGRYVESPLGNYRRNPSNVLGRPGGGGRDPKQSGHNFPFIGCGAPRTPIAKLYLATYDMTQLEGAYKAADAVAQDLGIRKQQDWWNVRPFEPLMKWFDKWGIKPHWTVD